MQPDYRQPADCWKLFTGLLVTLVSVLIKFVKVSVLKCV
jgi:hypothetical protein